MEDGATSAVVVRVFKKFRRESPGEVINISG